MIHHFTHTIRGRAFFGTAFSALPACNSGRDPIFYPCFRDMTLHSMNRPDRIFLIGPMGVGKTTVGRRLAASLDKEFVDSDHEIEERTGVNIPLIFELEGEAGFRSRESRMLDELTQRPGIVLATGGGAILDPVSRQRLRERGYVVYLHAPLRLLLQRTARDSKRPLLATPDRAARMRQIIAEREPLYGETAHLKVETGRHNIRKVVQRIVSSYEKC